ncbi:uncharacterized protein LOC127280218 isoform X2 [Leptopilina boulardi]|uniref:uncharacterized protein LOC127280218 isoform X2 n=1 Tax=Leptopilina boulardi TaxID=63433 RepID=UPI0021F58D47|nr:uncharacterized protein LOC127280218 isoform X2 [Leptopilina boulardi]
MLKWTVSRSLSTASSTPHGPPNINKTSRRPFRDLSNTPPAAGSKTKSNIPNAQNPSAGIKPTPGRRRRCRSHGSDLRGYFQATKTSFRSTKRQSLLHDLQQKSSEPTESFYLSTPRVDADIPLTLFPSSESRSSNNNNNETALTLALDPPSPLTTTSSRNFPSSNELPQNIVNEARANRQSHVSDFFQKIAIAASPEDIMEADSVPLCKRRIFTQNCDSKTTTISSEFARVSCIPKLARITKLHSRCRTPYHTKNIQNKSPFKIIKESIHTPLAGKLSDLKLDQDLPKFENVNNTVTEIMNREQKRNCGGKTVAEILLKDTEERRKILEGKSNSPEHIYEMIVERDDDIAATHSDSSISSASQLLENPSPLSWALQSPSKDFEGEFTLRRQRGIRRKRHQQKEMEIEKNSSSESKRAKKQGDSLNQNESTTQINEEIEEIIEDPLMEAVNRNVKRCPLETDLDSTLDDKFAGGSTTTFCVDIQSQLLDDSRRKASSFWDLESPKSSLLDDLHSTKSFLNSVENTPEAPLVATVRRCLKYSPEIDPPKSNSKGSIQIEHSVQDEQIHLKVIRCKDLRRTYEGPIYAYVKATLKNSSGVGLVHKRTAVHRATSNPFFHETLILPCPISNNNCSSKSTSLDIAVWHRDRRARRSELLGCMTLPLPLSQDKEATWHPLEAGSGRNTSTPYAGITQECGVSPPLSKNGESDNNNSNGEDLTYLRHLELEPIDPVTGLPLHPGFTARGGRTPCTTTRRLTRPSTGNPIPWGFSLSWGRPPRVERVDTGSPAERSGLRPGDHVVFVETTNVVTLPREEILNLIQASTNQLIFEVYRKGGVQSTINRPSSVNIHAPASQQHSVTFTAEVLKKSAIVNFLLRKLPKKRIRGSRTLGPVERVNYSPVIATVLPNITPDAPPEEELKVRESRYCSSLKSGQTRFLTPLAEQRDVLSSTDHMILFQNLEELLKISEELKNDGATIDSYLSRIPRIIASYRRYLSGLQRACCLLVALRRNSSFAKLVVEPTVPRRRNPDLTGVLLLPLEHYREMTRLLGLACPRNCQQARDLLQGYREATSNAGVMEPPRDSGKPLLSLQEMESRLVFARCKPFSLATPGRQWLFGGALTKVESRASLQSTWALLLTDILVFARVSRDRVLFVTEEPLHLSNIAEACFNVRKRPTEFRLQIALAQNENGHVETIHTGGCSPHSRPRRRVLILRAPTPELKAVWHNLLQRQIIYVNTCCDDASLVDSPEENQNDNFNSKNATNEYHEELQHEDEKEKFEDSLDIIKDSNHLAQWVQNSHQIPSPDQEISLEEWTAEELAARTPRENIERTLEYNAEETTTVNSDVEQQSTTSSASLSTVKSSTVSKKNGSYQTTISICRRCHKSGCPTPPLIRDPFSPIPPKISVLPPTPDICTRHKTRNGLVDNQGRDSPASASADGNTEEGSEDDLDADGEPPYRALRRFGTLSSLDQDDEIEEPTEEESQEQESPTGFKAWTMKASNYVVSKMTLLEHFGDQFLQPPQPPERTEFSLDGQNDEEGTTSGGTSGDDIWGTPTSGGPDDESFTASPVRETSSYQIRQLSKPPINGTGAFGEDNFAMSNDDNDELDSDDCLLPELNMDQLLGSASLGSLKGCFLGRRRLEPLPEEEDSSASGKQQVGWW